MRFVVSLKRSADPEGGQMWQLKHFSSVKFASDLFPGTQLSTDCENIEMGPFGPRRTNHEPANFERGTGVAGHCLVPEV